MGFISKLHPLLSSQSWGIKLLSFMYISKKKKKKRGKTIRGSGVSRTYDCELGRSYGTPEVFIVLKDISIQYFPRVTTLLSVQVFVLFSKLSL